jgi:hypothetical protein
VSLKGGGGVGSTCDIVGGALGSTGVLGPFAPGLRGFVPVSAGHSAPLWPGWGTAPGEGAAELGKVQQN